MISPPRLSIEFVIVGGSIAGMTAAVSLARAGHKVTVLDNDPDFLQSPMGEGCRVAPNATRLFYRWGMEEALRAASIKSTGLLFARWDNGTLVGTHEWEESVMEELGGDMLLISFAELRRILAECAVEHGAVLRPSCHVVSVTPDPDRPFVTLASGEVVAADVVIGADGNYLQNVTRKNVLEGIGEEDIAKPAGWQVYNALIPTSALEKLDDPTMLKLPESGKVHTWFSSASKTYGALGFPVPHPQTGAPLFALFIYVAREPRDCAVHFARKEELLQYLKGGDPRISALTEASTRILSIPMTQQPFLKEWVHRKGNVICIGQSAHPIPPGPIYPLSLSVGDAAALGQVFAHLHRKAQITDFLHAVQEIREARVAAVVAASVGNIFAGALLPGIADDPALRAGAEEEIRSLGIEGSHNTNDKMVSVVENVFAYDPEDAAESWWQRWGLTQERAERMFPPQALTVSFTKDQ